MQPNKLLLVIDVGNTNSEIGVFSGSKLIKSWRFMTKTPRTSDEFSLVITGFLATEQIDPDDIEDVIVASVVPNIMHSLNNGIKKTFGIKPMQVGPGIKTGMPILLTDPTEVGADRIMDSGRSVQAVRRTGYRYRFRNGNHIRLYRRKRGDV